MKKFSGSFENWAPGISRMCTNPE